MDVCKYKNCDVTDLIIKYLEPLMQICSSTMDDYNMKMRTTKCLNTAVMLTYILAGSNKLKTVEYCDVSKVNNRYDQIFNKKQHKLNIFNKLSKDIKNKNQKKRYFYYILMTNNMMNKSELVGLTKDDKQHFPGHVFIVDKFPDCENNDVIYNVYQSYINKYDLKGHYVNNQKTMRLKNNDAENMLEGIKNIIENDVWNQDAVDFWNRFTFVDTSNLLNYKTDKINLCYSRITIDDCYKHLYRFVYNKALTLYNDIIDNNIQNLENYQVNSNVDINDNFYVKQLKPEKLYSELRKLILELEDKILGNELK